MHWNFVFFSRGQSLSAIGICTIYRSSHARDLYGNCISFIHELYPSYDYFGPIRCKSYRSVTVYSFLFNDNPYIRYENKSLTSCARLCMHIL